MIFKFSMKLYFLLSIITIFVLNSVNASDKHSEKDEEPSDQFYLVLVKNKENGHNKREEKEQFLDSLVTEINNLIIGNKDTYDDPSVLDELEQISSPSPFTKRSVDEDEEESHKFAYVISSLEDEALILSYLSEDLVTLVNDLPNVKTVIPDIKMEYFSQSKNLKEIKSTYEWGNACVKNGAYNHLSLISQDKYDDSKNSTIYDESYYYPSSAGEDINIFILDGGFNFNHPEYSNRATRDDKNERTVQCIASVGQRRIFEDFTDKCSDYWDNGHGSVVADIAAGLTNGVASKANIYGLAIQYESEYAYVSSIVKALEYIDYKYLDITNPENVEKFIHKTVINMSNGFYFPENEKISLESKRDFTFYLYNLIDSMSNKGTVFVVAAGNDSVNADNLTYPCSFNNVICVGATDNIGINDDYNEMIEIRNNKSSYEDKDEWEEKYNEAESKYNKNYNDFMDIKHVSTKNYRTAHFSNYGEMVDIYAPGFVKAFYTDKYDYERVENWAGTSFSSPIVAGVAATIMSEHPYLNFNTKRMREYLQDIGLKDAIKGIKKEHQNLFVNNGKHISYSYSKDDEDEEDSGDLECFRYGCCLIN